MVGRRHMLPRMRRMTSIVIYLRVVIFVMLEECETGNCNLDLDLLPLDRFGPFGPYDVSGDV